MTRKRNRIAIVVIAIAVTSLGVASVRAWAGPTTTTALSPDTVAAGNAYAARLLAAQPIPTGARPVSALATPLSPMSSPDEGSDLRTATEYYLLPMTADVSSYVRANLPAGERIIGSGSGGGGGAPLSSGIGLSPTCASRHITYCGVEYAWANDDQQELVVDAQVVWMPLVHVEMPTSGVVSVTGFARLSLMSASSGATSIVLTHRQALQLRSSIDDLKDMNEGGICAEDATLLNVKVIEGGKVVWKAVGDECPGALTITSPRASHYLDDRSCSFWRTVDSFFSKGEAAGTRFASREICAIN
ncbi:MAG: hypothetical protein ACRDVC_05290 [Acidimicrobiales bacterium]